MAYIKEDISKFQLDSAALVNQHFAHESLW